MNPARHVPALLMCAAAAGALLAAGCATRDIPESPAGAAHTPVRPAWEVVVPEAGMLSHEQVAGYRDAWATQLIGKPVIDNRGGYLGHLVDLAVDTTSGKVRYAIVSDKRPAHGEKLAAVPVRLMRVTDTHDVFLDLEPAQFVQLEAWLPDRHAYPMSWLIGTRVDNHQGQHLGRIAEVVLDMNRQQVHYAVLGYAPHPGLPTEHAFAIPFDALAFRAGDSGRLVLNVPQERLASALATSDADFLPPLDAPRYLGTIDRAFGDVGPGAPRAIGGTR